MEDNYPFSVLKEAIARKVSPHAMWLLTYYITNPGESFKFHQSYILFLTGWGNKTYLKYRKELIEKGFITSEYARENGKRAGSYVTVNRTFSKVSDVNVSDKHLSTSKVSKGNVTKGNVTKGNVTERHDIREKVERERINKREEVETHASAPAGAAASVCVSPSSLPESPSQEGKNKASPKASKASKAPAVPVSENPPLQEDIAAFIRKTVSGRPEASAWNEQSISGTAFDIWNHYTNTGWKTAACCPMYSWQNAVIGWLRRNHWLPEQSQPSHQQSPVPAASPAPNELSGLLPGQWAGAPIQKPKQESFKQIEHAWINRPMTDPDSVTVENAAWCIFNACCEDEVQGTLNSIPAHLHERALALAEQMRKEQGDRPRIITPSTFTDNEDEPS